MFSPANVIFASAGVLLSVTIVLDLPDLDCSDAKSSQTAKDVIASQDALIDIFERVGLFFRRLEECAEVPMTEAMKGIIVKIMVEVLGIFGIMTKEIKQGRTSKLIPGGTFLVADREAEKYYVNKYLKKLTGRRDIEDALSRLDRLTRCWTLMMPSVMIRYGHTQDLFGSWNS